MSGTSSASLAMESVKTNFTRAEVTSRNRQPNSVDSDPTGSLPISEQMVLCDEGVDYFVQRPIRPDEGDGSAVPRLSSWTKLPGNVNPTNTKVDPMLKSAACGQRSPGCYEGKHRG